MPMHPEHRHFGPFAVDIRAGELSKHGRKIRLQDQPFKILLALLERPGEVVTRSELRAILWPQDTFVDFDNGLNNAVNRLRSSLGDSAGTHKYIETVGRRGYRFIGALSDTAEVERSDTAPASEENAAETVQDNRSELDAPSVWHRARWIAVAAVIVLVAVGGWMGRARTDAVQARADVRNLAVLPFQNISAQADDDYFAYGMMNALIGELMRLGSVRVISPNSTASYRDRPSPDLKALAKESGVDTILQGQVSRDAKSRRVAISLIDAATGNALWTETFESSVDELLQLRAEVVSNVVLQVQLKLAESNAHLAPGPMTSSSEAYDLYVRGQFETLQRNPAALLRAIGYFDRALALDPNFASAYAGLAWARLQQGYWPGSEHPRHREKEIKETISRALALNPNSAEAVTALGLALRTFDGDLAGAGAAYQRAIQLAPSLPIPRSEYSALLSMLGRYDDAIAEGNAVVRLDPYAPAYWHASGMAYLNARRYEEAESRLQRALSLDPTFAGAFDGLFALYLAQGRLTDARQISARMTSVIGGKPLPLRQAWIEAAGGSRSDVGRLLGTLNETETAREITSIAAVYATAGADREAFEWLNKAIDQRILKVQQLARPSFDSLRDRPEFLAVLRRSGLPPDSFASYLNLHEVAE